MRHFVILLLSFVCYSQTPKAAPQYRVNYSEVQQFLSLSDAQVEQLKQIQISRTAATEAIYSQVTAKQKQLNDLLTSGSTDALAIGKLSIDIQNLRSQTIAPSNERERSLAILMPSQRAKLSDLEQALALRLAADQAAGLHLIDYPRTAVSLRPLAPPSIK